MFDFGMGVLFRLQPNRYGSVVFAEIRDLVFKFVICDTKYFCEAILAVSVGLLRINNGQATRTRYEGQGQFRAAVPRLGHRGEKQHERERAISNTMSVHNVANFPSICTSPS